jgi:hypothetical protein
MEAVLSQLAAVAKERRERKPLPLHAVSRKTTVGDDAVRKFERGQQGQNIDRMANAYADALGICVFDLWDEAIKRAKEGVTAPPADEGGPVATAEEKMEEAKRLRRQEEGDGATGSQGADG